MTGAGSPSLDLGEVRDVVVTGCAGFIGSRLTELLLDAGCNVRGIDCFTDYYDRGVKDRNLAASRDHERFRFFEADLATADVASAIEGAQAVLHLAAMPGLVRSWSDVAAYSHCNVVATARLLDTVVQVAPSARHVQISTSSVYGLEATGDETAAVHPASPYGVTKLAAEHLVHAYESQFGLESVVLRYFSVYGPRQRPDMAYNIFCRALLNDTEIQVFGDGSAVRSNTFVDDCARGTVQAMVGGRAGETYNLGGGVPITVNEALQVLADASGRTPRIVYKGARKGDQKITVANFDKATRDFGYAPTVAPIDGLARQWEWQAAQPN